MAKHVTRQGEGSGTDLDSVEASPGAKLAEGCEKLAAMGEKVEVDLEKLALRLVPPRRDARLCRRLTRSPLAEARHAWRRAVIRLARCGFAVGHGEEVLDLEVTARRGCGAAACSHDSRSRRGVRTRRARRSARCPRRRSSHRSTRS
jgi:hypothetical protein